MFNVVFLLSMPGGTEWLILLFLIVFLTTCPVLAIVFYLQTKRLRQQNKELAQILSYNWHSSAYAKSFWRNTNNGAKLVAFVFIDVYHL